MSEVKDQRQRLIYPAERVLEKDLVELKNLPSGRRQDLFDELEENKGEYEWEMYPEHREVIPDRTKEVDLQSFEAAKLMLAAAVTEDADPGAGEREYVGQFEDEELEFVREFDDIRRKFKRIDEDQLEDHIKNREGEVYEFVQDEVRKQVGMRSTLLDTQNNEIRGAAISYFMEEFDEFFELANQAVFLFIKHHGLPNTIEGIVDAADAAADASEERERVDRELRERIRELSETLHEGLRDQERTLQAEMDRLRTEVASGGADAEAVEGELAELRSRIEELSRDRERDVDAISERLDDIQRLERDLEGKIEELESTRERTLEDLKEDTEERAETLIEDELERLQEQKSELAAEVNRLRTERERLETTGERLDEEYEDLERRVASAEERLDEGYADLEERLDEISESVRGEAETPEGKAVRAQVARLYEMDYIGRFEQSVREADRLALPDGDTFEVPDGFWDDRRRSLSGDHRQMVEDAIDDETADRAERYPVGRYSVFRVLTTGFMGLTSDTDLVIEAVVSAHLEAFAANGFDASPAGLDDLLDIVNETLARSQTSDAVHLIGIASPTGWTDEVVDLVRNEEYARTQFGDRVSVCLVDIQSGELVYDPNDRLVRENRSLFEREVDDDRLAACVETIRDEYVGDPTVRIVRHHEVVSDHDFDPNVVDEAFEKLETEGEGEQVYPEGAKGLCLLIDRP